MNYKEAKDLFSTARNKSNGKPLENNTRLVETTNGYGIKLHNTIVVDIKSNGNYVLNTGGWYTNTTKDRINRYSPFNVYSHKRIWYLGLIKKIPFTDGIIITCKGKVIKSDTSQIKRIETTLKKIDNYVTKYAEALKNNQIPQPSSGDCWGCCMHTTTGETVMGTDHLEQHMKENYLVPSLLVNAIIAKGYKPEYVNPWNGLRTETTLFKRCIKDYLIKNLAK